MPSTPALLETTVRFFTPESRSASDSVSAMPHRPKPPDMIIMPSLRIPSRADLASGWTLFMKMRPDGGSLMACTRVRMPRIIRRNCRKASIVGLLHKSRTPDGLESVKKTPQVASVVMGPPACRRSPIRTVISAEIGPTRVWLMYNPPHFNRDSTTSTRPGYVIDDGPRNEAPGDADCRASRRGADRPDLDVLVSRPGRLASGGRGANPRRDRPRSGDQRQYRRFGVSRKLRLLA